MIWNALIVICILFSTAHASQEGLSPEALKNYPIAGFTRPCCSFGLNVIGKQFGVEGVIGFEELGQHHFSRLNKQQDKVGIVYTCRGGFVDVSHLRDNADWAAHLYFKLPLWLGSGLTIKARNEGGFKSRSVYFPKLTAQELSDLSEDDREALAISIGFNLALLHEIPTSFKIPVSSPHTLIVNERNSAFSLEDAYSNLLGNTLGAKAARSSAPYDTALTELLHERLQMLRALNRNQTYAAFAEVRNDWWIKGLFANFKHVLKRDFTYEGQVTPRLMSPTPLCEAETPGPLSIPHTLSNGKSVHDYFEIQGEVNKRFERAMGKMGLSTEKFLTQKQYPEVIEAVKRDFIKRLGQDILTLQVE